MTNRTWIILGATSIIAREFCHLAAQAGHNLILVGRDPEQLAIIAADLHLRHHVNCEVLSVDFSASLDELIIKVQDNKKEFDLFIAHALMVNNDKLDKNSIEKLIDINIVSTIQIIQTYMQKEQNQHRLIYLSSVAACRGRAKNSLYGASKAAIEIYLQGLQQTASANQHITIARLGFIDTRLTYGEPGIFYAASPKACAYACWKASLSNKQLFYYPRFWRVIMGIMTRIPFFIYKRMGSV